VKNSALNTVFRKSVAWPMFWFTYGQGHLASLVCECRWCWPDDIADGTWHDKLFSLVFSCYQTGMRDSIFWSDWGDLKQWSNPS